MERNFRQQPNPDSYRDAVALDPEISEIDAALEEWVANGMDPNSSTVTRLKGYRDTLYRQKRRSADSQGAQDRPEAPIPAEVGTPVHAYSDQYVSSRHAETVMAVSPVAIGSSAISHQVSGSGPNL